MPAASLLRAATAAVTFLTRVPLGRLIAVDARDVARGAIVFPFVGAGIGALFGGVGLVLHPRLSPFLAASIAIAVAVLVTGAMHVDALADTVDALGASTRERALGIMRDPRIGSFGAVAIGLDLLVKVAAVAQLLDAGAGIAVFVAAGALSRGVPPVLATVLPYPRVEGGPGSVLSGKVSLAASIATPLLAFLIAVGAARTDGAFAALAVGASALVLGVAFQRWLGGATGDMLGAATEVAETVALVVAAAFV